MSRVDASLLARVEYASLACAALTTDYVVISRSADGTPHCGFVEARRESPLRDGFGAAFWDDGSLRHFGFYDAGSCISSVDLHSPSEHGLFRQGRKMRAGELYARGTIETLGPWSDNDAATPTDQSFADWVVKQIAAVQRAS